MSDRKNSTKIAIIVLSILLALSLAALGAIFVRKYVVKNNSQPVVVTNNIITPDDESAVSSVPASGVSTAATEKSGTTAATESSTKLTSTTVTTSASTTKTTTAKTTSTTTTKKVTSTSAAKTTTSKKLTTLSTTTTKKVTTTTTKPVTTAEPYVKTTLKLHKRQSTDNVPFSVRNMFPGDKITQNFCVQVSYNNTVKVHFRVNVNKGYEKLAEVLKCRIVLKNTGEIIYDGLMNKVSDLTYTVRSTKATDEDIYYEITAYLETSVGNEYQQKNLLADFIWWTQDVDNLEPSPNTGDTFNIVLWVCVAVSSSAIILLLCKRKKEGSHEQ